MTEKESMELGAEKPFLQIKIDKDLKHNLKVYCATAGVTMTELMEALIEEFLTNPKTINKNED